MNRPTEQVRTGSAVYYGSSLGRVQRAAEQIAGLLGAFRCVDIHFDGIAGITDQSLVVLGLSTWYTGELQRDWALHLDEVAQLDWSGCQVAMFCLGDQYGYPRTFGDGLALLWDVIGARGATLIGRWDPACDPIGYEFEKSLGLRDGRFLGLMLDEDNQAAATTERITRWVEQIRREHAQ
jgi:flavodoxin long chain